MLEMMDCDKAKTKQLLNFVCQEKSDTEKIRKDKHFRVKAS